MGRDEWHGGNARKGRSALAGGQPWFSKLSAMNAATGASGPEHSLHHLRCFPAGRGTYRHRHRSWNRPRGFVTRDDQLGENDAKSVLERG